MSENLNTSTFTLEEYAECKKKLRIKEFKDLVGQAVFYSESVYGIHKVIEWDEEKSEYKLEIEGSRFWTNPFRLFK
jgi:hypothetical protein